LHSHQKEYRSDDTLDKSEKIWIIISGIPIEFPAIILAIAISSQIKDILKSVFWTLFVAMAGLVLARVVDPVTARQVVGMIPGIGMWGRGCTLLFFKSPSTMKKKLNSI
jgi:hypothetical protein